MTLRSKLLWLNAILLAGVLTLGAACLWGLLRQRAHVRASLAEYGALQRVESAAMHVLAAKGQLHEPAVDRAKVAADLHQGLDALREYKAMLGMYDQFLPPEITDDRRAQARAKTKAAAVKLTALTEAVDATVKGGGELPTVAAKADEVSQDLGELLRVCNAFMNRTDLTSEADLHVALWVVGALATAIPLVALLVTLWQYHRVTAPLLRLRAWSRRVAVGDFSQPYEAGGGEREFVELGRDVNEMAAELQAFYRQLEERVSAKSRELVRSERLASVGYLAAGVAHEINNPLNVMSGYAELSTKKLKRSADEATVGEVLGQLNVIREEAFRCKQITGKLLSLAKGSGDARDAVSLTRVASDVALMVRGLRNFRGRKLDVAIDPAEPLAVEANLTEMKQVMLNLTVNALEAARAGDGEVTIGGRRDGTWAEVTVSDNGRGMTRETLERVFEPFFTDKRGAGEPGTGLGLSITHAIVADHGGQIRAESDGPGRGSRFVVRLPAMKSSAGAGAATAAAGGTSAAPTTRELQETGA